ncbi:MAG: glutamate-5-semialdehyde dehydrogenase [Lysobacterales bacterium]|jgi:glutamate-5-semialdehyde dehydrogenase
MNEQKSNKDLLAADQLRADLLRVKAAAPQLASHSDETISQILLDLAEQTLKFEAEILAANQLDLARMDKADPKYDRLLLNHERLAAIAGDLCNVAALVSPVGQVLEQRTLESGMDLKKVRVPIGVVAVIFESRPNVTFDVAALCLKTRNACVLKGSSDAHDSNLIIVKLIHSALEKHGLDASTVFLAPAGRECLPQILQAVGVIDLAIPRGSRGLIDFVRDHARIPVIETGAGIVHTYVDSSADLKKAKAIITNAKTRRVSVCNALDTLLVHQDLLGELAEMLRDLGEQFQVEVFADDASFAVLDGNYSAILKQAEEKHFGEEFLAYRMSIKTVSGLDDALEHIQKYSSKHSEAIVAENSAVIEQFLNRVDAASVFANASTAFADGAQFGMGAEIGISTQKLHARGPMALPELTSYKWIVRGDGQIRP